MIALVRAIDPITNRGGGCMRSRSIIRVAFILALSLFSFSSLGVNGAAADGGEAPPPQQGLDNDTCLTCHDVPGMQMELASGEALYLTVDGVSYITSSHGREGIACVDCHTGFDGFPHEPVSARSIREFTLDQYTLCADCHQDKYDATLDSVHQRSLAGGNLEAAVCTDCHNPHSTQPPDVPRSRIPQTCERCHSQIYDGSYNGLFPPLLAPNLRRLPCRRRTDGALRGKRRCLRHLRRRFPRYNRDPV